MYVAKLCHSSINLAMQSFFAHQTGIYIVVHIVFFSFQSKQMYIAMHACRYRLIGRCYSYTHKHPLLVIVSARLLMNTVQLAI